MIPGMKLNLLYLGKLTLLVLILSSCGKKAEVEDKAEKESLAPSVAEIRFNALKEIKRAINENDLEALKDVLQENPDVDLNQIQSETGETFLTTTIKNDFRLIRNLLIDEESVSLEKTNAQKETPLIAAVIAGSENSVKVLLDYKVDLEKKEINGNTALHVALKKSNDQLALLLIKQGANIHATDSMERNALKLAIEYNCPQSLVLIKSIMEMEFGAPDITTYRNLLLRGDYQSLKNILARYPRIATDKLYQEINPLALLVGVREEREALKSAELLLKYDANVNGPEQAEQTPLIKATINLKKGFANLYLSSHANPQLLDQNGKSALIHAVELNNADLVDLLLSYSAAERYSLRKNGERITYNACETARETGRKFPDDSEAKKINERIRKSLDCGFLRWFF
jgi:ankyrin repeat protein